MGLQLSRLEYINYHGAIKLFSMSYFQSMFEVVDESKRVFTVLRMNEG